MSPRRSRSTDPRLGLALACALAVLAASPATGASLFFGGDTFPLAAPAGALCVDDLDRDGRPDVAAVHAAEPRISVVLGEPAGLLGTPATYAVGLGAVFVTSGDLDGDDRPDLVVVNGGVSTVSILRNDGSGRFLPGAEVPVGRDPRAAALADFDGDGDLDLVTTNFAAGDLAVLLGDGRGAFPAESRVRVGDNPHDLTIADLDGDGASDVAVAHTGAVSWFRGLRDGSFERAEDIVLAPDPRVITAGDFDADGRVDLAVIDERGTVLCLRNRGDGAFASVHAGTVPGFEWAPGRAGFLVAIDLDRDGFLDLVTEQTRILDSGLRVIPGDSGLSFGAPNDIFLDTSAADLAFEDFDQDGLVDAVVTQSGVPGLAIYRGRAPGRLRARRVVPLDDAPRDLVALDLGRDGREDLVALGSSAVQVIRATADGGLEPPVDQAFPGRSFQGMASADFDADGRPDLALTDVSRRSLVIAFLDDEGSVTRTEAISVGDLPTRLATGDVDSDGLPDAVVLDQVSASVTVVLGPGKGLESRTIGLPVASGQVDLSIADADRDGALDIAVATRADVRILFGDGAGGFPRSVASADLARSTALALADVDSDGAVELAVVVSDRKLSLFGGLAAGALERRGQVDLPEAGRVLRVRDVDRDGYPELLVAAAKSIVAIRGSAAGPAATVEGYVVGSSPRAIALADLNADGALDAATADFGSESVSILDGATAASAPLFRRGDVDGDGRPSITDAVSILEGLFLGGAAPLCPDAADVDDGGTLNLTDAVSLLGYLFLGGPPPEPPGPEACGPDPSADDLEPCGGACAP